MPQKGGENWVKRLRSGNYSFQFCSWIILSNVVKIESTVLSHFFPADWHCYWSSGLFVVNRHCRQFKLNLKSLLDFYEFQRYLVWSFVPANKNISKYPYRWMNILPFSWNYIEPPEPFCPSVGLSFCHNFQRRQESYTSMLLSEHLLQFEFC